MSVSTSFFVGTESIQNIEKLVRQLSRSTYKVVSVANHEDSLIFSLERGSRSMNVVVPRDFFGDDDITEILAASNARDVFKLTAELDLTLNAQAESLAAQERQRDYDDSD